MAEYFFNFNKMGYLKKPASPGCILCMVRDGSGSVERLVVHEREGIIVSVNLYPYNPGHLILFPSRHVLDLRELTHAEQDAMNDEIKVCLGVLDSVYKPAGYNIGYNMGRPAGASIDHLHLHIIPRYRNEIGMAELLGGKKVLVQSPHDSYRKLLEAFSSLRQDGEQI